MSYGDWQINGNRILEPTTGRWLPRRPLDVQGDNRPIYPGVRSFELRYQLTSSEEWATLQANYRNIESSGTVTARLPEFPTITGSPYAFREYSGCTMAEPSIGQFFETYPRSVVLLIHNIVIE
jgi:hypothetical protein